MKQALITMLELQDTMNATVNSEWRAQGNAWYRAIWVECAELLDHYGWKWWKAQQPDVEQVELELIDIWHFGISIALETCKQGDYESLADTLERQLSSALGSVDDDKSPEAFRCAVEAFAQNTLQGKEFDAEGFARLMAYIDLSFDGLFRRYVAKNVLNIFRQNHGYKEGTYRKLWGGREDNEHLMELLADLDQSDISHERIYSGLSERYQQSA